jgi:hypothetical protein
MSRPRRFQVADCIDYELKFPDSVVIVMSLMLLKTS